MTSPSTRTSKGRNGRLLRAASRLTSFIGSENSRGILAWQVSARAALLKRVNFARFLSTPTKSFRHSMRDGEKDKRALAWTRTDRIYRSLVDHFFGLASRRLLPGKAFGHRRRRFRFRREEPWLWPAHGLRPISHLYRQRQRASVSTRRVSSDERPRHQGGQRK